MPSIPSAAPVIVDHGQIVSIITWILLVTSALAVLARLFTKWAVSRRLHADDGFAVSGLVCYEKGTEAPADPFRSSAILVRAWQHHLKT